MKIAQVVSTFPPHHGGMGYVCFHNALELARRGHDVAVFTLAHGDRSYDDGRLPFAVKRLHTKIISGDAGIVPQLLSLLKGYDIVHLHYPFFGGAEFVYLFSMLRRTNYCLTYHMDVVGNTIVKRTILKLYDLAFFCSIIRNAKVIVALSRAHLESSKAAPVVDWGKVVEIPNGVDVEHFFPSDKDVALVQRYSLQGKIVVLFVGNLQPFKGLPLLIRAISRIDDPRIVLLIVGGGYDELFLRSQVNELKIQERVVFAGPQSPSGSLPAHYRLGDFLVLPSTHSESFGLVVLEAMATGIPAIVSSLPGPAQLVQEGKDGLIARVGDAEDLKEKIELLAREPEKRREMGRAARAKVVRDFGWERIGEQLESVLLKIAK